MVKRVLKHAFLTAQAQPPLAKAPVRLLNLLRVPSCRVRSIGRQGAFTLIELLVVLTIVSLLLTLALPRYLGALEQSREAALKENLRVLRTTIDQFHADRGRYPATLGELVNAQYLRSVPTDPMTERADTWIIVVPPHPQLSGVYDVRSASPGHTRQGLAHANF